MVFKYCTELVTVKFEGLAVPVSYCMTGGITIDAEAASREIYWALDELVIAPAASTNVMQPLAVLGEMRSTSIVIMTVTLTFGAALRFA
jgi:hypothetical protein